jgi:hypothetical protein
VTDAEAFEYYEDPAKREPAPGSPRRRPKRLLTQHVPMRFPGKTIQRVKRLADAEGVTASVWIRHAIDEKLRRQLGDDRLDSHG